MVVNPGMRRILRSALTRLYNREVQIFAGGRNGYLHRFTTLELNQLSTGTTPVTAVTDPVGFVADTRLGMALGAELVDTINTAAAWTASGTNTVEQDGDYVKITYVDNAAGAVALFSAAAGLNSNLTVAANYKITYETKVNSGSVNAAVVGAATNQSVAITSTTYITQSFVFNASHASTNNFTFANMSAGEIVWIKVTSVRLFEGNHCIQATALDRSTWQVDATGHNYLSFLGAGDSLTSATGGGGSAGFFWCGVVQPMGGAGGYRALLYNYTGNSGYLVTLDVNNKFAFWAGNGVAYTQLATTATVDVGTKYLLTCWDDGVNMYVQINAATAESVARPVVAAGPANFAIGRDNNAASAFLIGNLYPSVYWKDTAGTAAERADAQAYCRAMGGL